jgi:hypothetical protein
MAMLGLAVSALAVATHALAVNTGVDSRAFPLDLNSVQLRRTSDPE